MHSFIDVSKKEPVSVPEPKYALGTVLAKDGNYYGTIVRLEGLYPCRYYGLRMRDVVGICMVRTQLLDDPKQYPNLVVVE